MATYKLGPVRLGAEAKYSYGTKFGDSYLLGLGILKLGPFYGGAGVVAKITAAEDPSGEYYFATTEKRVTPALTTGLIIKPISLGPGKLGFNTALDIYASDTPVDASTVEDQESLVGAVMEGAIGGTINAILNLFKFSAGVNYTITF
ncbi:MAG: hypothetical protein ACOC7U_10355 [Spirochaetota bacterium]